MFYISIVFIQAFWEHLKGCYSLYFSAPRHLEATMKLDYIKYYSVAQPQFTRHITASQHACTGVSLYHPVTENKNGL